MLFYLSKGSYINNTKVTIEKPQRLMEMRTAGTVWTNAEATGEYNNLEAFLPLLKVPTGSCWLVEVEEKDDEITVRIIDKNVAFDTFYH